MVTYEPIWYGTSQPQDTHKDCLLPMSILMGQCAHLFHRKQKSHEPAGIYIQMQVGIRIEEKERKCFIYWITCEILRFKLIPCGCFHKIISNFFYMLSNTYYGSHHFWPGFQGDNLIRNILESGRNKRPKDHTEMGLIQKSVIIENSSSYYQLWSIHYLGNESSGLWPSELLFF